MKTTELEWGFRIVEKEAPAWWGCRAILSYVSAQRGRRLPPHALDIVWDRTSLKGENAAQQRLVKLLDGGALDKLREYAAHHGFELENSDSLPGRCAEVDLGGVHFLLRGAGGYLYVSACELEVAHG